MSINYLILPSDRTPGLEEDASPEPGSGGQEEEGKDISEFSSNHYQQERMNHPKWEGASNQWN